MFFLTFIVYQDREIRAVSKEVCFQEVLCHRRIHSDLTFSSMWSCPNPIIRGWRCNLSQESSESMGWSPQRNVGTTAE